MFNRIATFLVAAVAMSQAQAQISSLDLGNYQLQSSHSLGLLAHNPETNKQADEASAVTWNRDTGTLFVVEDEGTKIYEISTSGAVLGSMSLTGFQDTEGLTYMGAGKFAIAEERLRDIYQLSYTAGGSVARSTLQSIDLGSTVGNVGVEGVSYDPIAHNFVFVKETSPTEVNLAANPGFASGTATISSLLSPAAIAALDVLDLADVQVLATVPSLAGTADQDNLLLLSQESSKLLEVSRSGTVLSMFDLASLNASAIEGVTIGDNGNIYLVAEPDGNSSQARLFTLAPVPLPAAAWLLLSGLGALGFARTRGI